jgi:hypothetical protein
MNEELQRLLDLEISDFEKNLHDKRQQMKSLKLELSKLGKELSNRVRAKNVLLGIKTTKKSYKKKEKTIPIK